MKIRNLSDIAGWFVIRNGKETGQKKRTAISGQFLCGGGGNDL